MTRKVIGIFLLVGCCLLGCASKHPYIEDLPNEIPISDDGEDQGVTDQLRVKIVGDQLYISAKLDDDKDILYWFRKCMFNEIFTFYRVGVIDNNMKLPTNLPDATPSLTLNLAYSDNIGPFNISGFGWAGGNHAYIDNVTKTASTENVAIYLDNKIATKDTLALVDYVHVKVVNHIMNPAKPQIVEGKTKLNELLCTESVDYYIRKNNIQVSVTHSFDNENPVEVQMYYGMQSMFEKETYTMTLNGKYSDWTLQSEVDTFLKKDYPFFRKYVEKNSQAYQSSFLIDTGLGSHDAIADDDIIFIGNSNGKSYHKIISHKQYKRGDVTAWQGVYTWFIKPIADDADILCYEGVINGKNTIFIDCKKAVDKEITLPDKCVGKLFSFYEKTPNSDITVTEGKELNKTMKISSSGASGCILIFN